MSVRHTCFVLLLLAAVAPALAAGPSDPVSVVRPPEDRGAIFSPGVRLLSEVADDYVEEEFLVRGAANNYTYAQSPRRGELLLLTPDLPYTTRLIVRRPDDPRRFSGSVVIEWWNSTAGFDTAPVWDPSAEFFVQEGWIYVGVTNSSTSIQHLLAGCSIFPGVLPTTCGTRYAGLSIPENGIAFEMMSQIAYLLKSESAERPIPLDYDVRRIYHAGQSQQGGSIITYASAFHEPVNDGYFVQAASTARPINFQPDCADPTAPPYPACTPRLQGSDRLVATDLPVPVLQSLTETDLPRALSRGVRQPDTATFRLYEMPGVAHSTVHRDVDLIPGILRLEDTCLHPLNTSADGPVFGSYLLNAMWANLDGHVARGQRLPHAEPIRTDEKGEIVRDIHGNALGGIRLPALEVPIATYTGTNTVDVQGLPSFLQGFANLFGLFCALSGSTFDFDPATLASLYQNNRAYVNRVQRSAEELEEEGFLLHGAVLRILADAEAADILGEDGCGRGAAAALALVPLALWRRRCDARHRKRRGSHLPPALGK